MQSLFELVAHWFVALSAHPYTQHWVTHTPPHLALYTGAGVAKSEPRAHVARALHTEQSPSPPKKQYKLTI